MKKIVRLSLLGILLVSVAVFTACAKPKPKRFIANKVSMTGSAEALKRITVGGLEEKVLDLSPDGQWLLVEVYKGDCKKKRRRGRQPVEDNCYNHSIQKMKLNSGIKMLITPKSSSNRDAVWHPNQKSFIYITNRMGKYTVVRSMGISGGSGVRFISKQSLGNTSKPDITSDGKLIAFTAEGMLTLIKPDGTNITMLGNGYRPKFSPDDKKIAYIQYAGDYAHIYTMTKDALEITQLTSEKTRETQVIWSPDGKRLAFISNRVGGYRHLFIMNLEGSDVMQLTDGKFNVNSVVWGNNGYMYFSSDAGGNNDIWALKPKDSVE